MDLRQLRLHRCRRAEHLEHRPDARHDVGEIVGEEVDLAALVGLVAHRERLGALHHVADGRAPAEAIVDHRRQHPRLAAEGGVDGVDGYVGTVGDLLDRGAGIALRLEQLGGRPDDAGPCLRGLLLADR